MVLLPITYFLLNSLIKRYITETASNGVIITKSKDRVDYLKEQRRLANQNCKICPYCGEKIDMMEYFTKGIVNKGISSGTCKTWASGLFKTKFWQVDCYHCKTCGTEWETKPYERT